jgi:hypothetical protein
MVPNELWRGIQYHDARVRRQIVCGKYSSVWLAPRLPSHPYETEPQALDEAAKNIE